MQPSAIHLVDRKEVKRTVRGKSALVTRWVVLFVIVALAALVPFLLSLVAARRQAIPFVGMSMVYYAVDWNGETQIRTVSVLRYDAGTNHVIVRDSEDQFDVMEVDLGTREVVRHTGGWPYELYVEYWIPTNINTGSHVNILSYDAVVVGSTEMRVDGRDITVWKLQVSYQSDGGVSGQDTWYYDKSTGLWVAAAWVEWDSGGNVISNWGGHLVSTNVVLGQT